MAYKAVDQGASGVDMGRNIFQRKVPEAMIQAVRGVVHGGFSPEQAQSMYQELSGGLAE
jgi:putative autoinducer-2 (AI-2) aldolase